MSFKQILGHILKTTVKHLYSTGWRIKSLKHVICKKKTLNCWKLKILREFYILLHDAQNINIRFSLTKTTILCIIFHWMQHNNWITFNMKIWSTTVLVNSELTL